MNHMTPMSLKQHVGLSDINERLVESAGHQEVLPESLQSSGPSAADSQDE